jgi:hypothetical protein
MKMANALNNRQFFLNINPEAFAEKASPYSCGLEQALGFYFWRCVMTKFQRLPLLKIRARISQIRKFLKECGLSNEEVIRFSDTALMEVGDMIAAGAFGKDKI